MKSILKRLTAFVIAFMVMVSVIPFNAFAADATPTETNIQFHGNGGEFRFEHEGCVDYNAPHVGVGVKNGFTLASSYNMLYDPTYSNYVFLGWSATADNGTGTMVQLLPASGRDYWTTAEALAYRVDGSYSNIYFKAYWGVDADGNPITGTNNRDIGVMFDVWSGTVDCTYNNNKPETVSSGRFYVAEGENAGKYGAVVGARRPESPCAVLKGWQLHVYCNGELKYESNTLMSTSEALNYNFSKDFTADNTTYTDCNYVFAGAFTTTPIHTPVKDGNNPVYYTSSEYHWHECATCKRQYDMEKHDDTSDNDSVCNKCGYGTQICRHTQKVENGVPQYEIGPAGHRPICEKCGRPYDGEEHYDNNNDNTCDACGETMDCAHTNEGRRWETRETTHTLHCVCGYPVSPAEPHTDADKNNSCDSCHIPVVLTNGSYVHNHTSQPGIGLYADRERHFKKCDTCGSKEYDIARHTDATGDGKCDGCTYTVTTDNGGNVTHPHSYANKPAAMGKNSHADVCTECRFEDNFENHTDTVEDNKCDECGATLADNNVHIHQPKGDWMWGEINHSCQCTECPDWIVEGHTDDDKNGKCDICPYFISCQHKEIVKSNFYRTTEGSHCFVCGDCSEELNAGWKDHIDTDKDSKCDDCKVSVVIEGEYVRHPHTWATSWIIEQYVHHKACTDEKCTDMSFGMAHYDSGNDSTCDTCGTANNGWCTGHISNKELHIEEDKHYKVCENCNGGYDGENHVNDGKFAQDEIDGEAHWQLCTVCEYHIEGTYELHTDADMDYDCDICGYDKVPHDDSNGYEIYKDGHAIICTHCGLPFPDTVSAHTAGDSYIIIDVEDNGHARACTECNVPVSAKEAHVDTDKDLYCDKCDVKVNDKAQHIHELSGWTADNADHYKYCTDCKLYIETEPHVNTAGNDDKCDVCKATLDNNNEHMHTEKVVFENDYGHKAYCTDCAYIIGYGPHDDYNNDYICDICNTSYTYLKASVKADTMDSITIAFRKAAEAMVAGDYSHIRQLASCEDKIFDDFADTFRWAIREDLFKTFTATAMADIQFFASEAINDPDAKRDLDMITAKINSGTVDMMFMPDIVGEIIFGVGGRNGFSLDKAVTSQPIEYTITLPPAKAAANRTWQIFITKDEGETFMKIAQSSKGGNTITFTTDMPYDAHFLVFKDEAASGGTGGVVAPEAPAPAPTATPTPTPTPTPAPTATPAPTVEPTPTPVPEMPEKADTTITEVVASEAVVEAVKENIKVEEGTATVDIAVMDAVTAATEEDAPIILPLTQATEEVVNKAEVSAEALETVAEAEKDVVIELTDVTVKLDAETVKAITEQADGATIEIRAVKAEHHNLTDAQQKGLENKEVEAVVTAQIFSDGKYIGDFKGGKATIKLPFQPKDGRDGKHHHVYFVDDNGKTTKVPSEFVDGHMVFTTSHFSDYIVVYEAPVVETPVEPQAPEAPAESSMPIIPIIGAAAVLAVVMMLLKKKKADA